jgi:hypothetical protein
MGAICYTKAYTWECVNGCRYPRAFRISNAPPFPISPSARQTMSGRRTTANNAGRAE